jgi:Rod binding domain-containing protein
VFALELVKAMKSGAIDSENSALGSGAYGDMVTEALAGSLAASGGLGFGRYMVKQLEARKASIAAAEAEEAEEASRQVDADTATPASGTPAVGFNLLAR